MSLGASPASEPAMEPLVLYSTWRGRLGSLVTPLLLGGFGIGALVRAGRPAPVAVGFLVVGLVLGAVALADYPWRCRFDETGATRCCPLRRHHLAWDRVDALRRAPGPLLRRLGRGDEGRQLAIGLGGLVACIGRRRYLLVDTVESRDEWTAVRARLEAWAPHVGAGFAPPPDGAPPTWLYHRRRQRP